jgi:hypothetical protein
MSDERRTSPAGSIPGLGSTTVSARIDKDGSVWIFQRWAPSGNLACIHLSPEQAAYVREVIGGAS